MTKKTLISAAIVLAMSGTAFAKGHTSEQAKSGAGDQASVNEAGAGAATNAETGPTGGKANKGASGQGRANSEE